MVSSAASIELQKECLRRGADGFLSKPLDIEHLLSLVRVALRGGDHATLVNPQSCGTTTATANYTAWSGQTATARSHQASRSAPDTIRAV